LTTPLLSNQAKYAELLSAVQELSMRVREMEARLPDNTAGWAGSQTNVTEDRGFDADATTLDEVADVLGTLISDLVAAGVLR
jgi:hypothetical protein